MARRDWSRQEVKVVVHDYLTMLDLEIDRRPYNKTEHRRNLQLSLENRSDASIERKHQNISAILIEHGYPYIDGYKPLGNYQHLLAEVVREALEALPELDDKVSKEVTRKPEVPSVEDWLSIMVDPPVPRPPLRKGYVHQGTRKKPIKVNHLEQEARNSALGHAGELLVINYERARLIHEGAPTLANKVEHIAVTAGDQAGFDILSFDVDCSERLIEVKTTSFGIDTPFFVSRNQVETSIEHAARYHLYRVFRFSRSPGCFSIKGALNLTCILTPEKYSGRMR
ncbi:DUF3883 domain-containing protein [Gemmatimonadota bacterium]